MYLPYRVVDDFEKEVAKFAGSKYAIAIDSCSNALFLCCYYLCYYLKVHIVSIPKHTYFSVPCSIIHAGGEVVFDDREWSGCYQLKPHPIYDSALRFRKGMYIKGSYYCVSFHAKKHLPIGRGGMILTDDPIATKWFKSARIDGRHEIAMKQDKIDMLGWNMYMTPEQAARGLLLLDKIKSQPPLPDLEQHYPDLSKFEVYK
jgi:dTDP-4-amino-4,6-dideoxygalactose transaminase